MRLVRMEVSNYRSIRSQSEEESVELESLNCLVGPNNAGKTNLLKAIRYLLEGERDDDSLYYGRDRSLEIDVRGYFKVSDTDLDRLKIEEKREAVRNRFIEGDLLGVCNRSSTGDLELISPYPVEERLHPDQYIAVRDAAWDEKEDKADFRDRMMGEFPELIPYLREGKESNKGEWEYAYDELLLERPEGIEFELRPGPPPQGISADLRNFLPDVLVVPAVKEVSEATKTTRTGELGSLLAAVSTEIQEELDKAIDDALAEVSRQLNVIRDGTTEGRIDERHETVRSLESRISQYVRETFPTHGISLQFPNPESSVMFDNARVWVEEEGHERVLVEHVGEGVKRILIFSLIRTLADLRHGKLTVDEGGTEEDAEEERPSKPILLLYEEAELFLHPGLQKILLDTLVDLSESGDQVVFSTHSPFVIPDISCGGITLVRKTTGVGTRTLEIASTLQDRLPRHRRRLREVQSVSSYIFSDKVVLVEGLSDRVVIEKIVQVLNPECDLRREGITILPVMGKGNLPSFRDFLREIGIRAFVVADCDAIETVVGNFDLDEEAHDLREEYLRVAGEIAGEIEEEIGINREAVQRHVDGLAWDGVFGHLESLHVQLAGESPPSPDELAALERLVRLRGESARRQAMRSDEGGLVTVRQRLQSILLDHDVLLLNTEIEDYYPNDGGNKTAAALEFDPHETTADELRDRMSELPDGERGDLEELLFRVCDSDG